MNVPANSLVSLTDVCSREELIHALYEAAELEHCLMCTYLYAAASLKSGEAEGLTPVQAEAVARWRQEIIHIAVEEMSHLAAVWNITSALGGAPRFGRANFPLDVGVLPADIVVKLAPFNCATLQHFIYLERPLGSSECEGEGFAAERRFLRGHSTRRLTPMSMDYEAVGTFYLALSEHLQSAATAYGEGALFCGNRKLQLSQAETNLSGAKPVFCSKTAVQAFHTIIEQGEGSSSHTDGSHFNRFAAIRTEFEALQAADPNFVPAHPAATNPVLRRPPRPEGRIWLENEQAIATVDLANACYGLMMRLLAYSYQVPGPSAEKSAAIDLGIGLMRACMPLAELAARLPAGPSNPNCNAGMSFTALRDAAAFPMEASSWQAFNERFQQLASAASALAADGNERSVRAAGHLHQLAARALRAHTQGFAPA
ncbi:MAG: ferritin-like domain-containing protein, partial [Pseudomonadota bacterium]